MMSDDREYYISDGGISWFGLPILVGGAAATSLACGLIMHLLLHAGWYLIGVVPVMLAMLLGGTCFVLVLFAHCRNRRFAGLVGLMAGVAAYFSYFYFGLMSQLPLAMWTRVDIVPSYILARMNTDVEIKMGRPQPVKKQPDRFGNWSTFAFDLLIFVSFPAGFAWAGARGAYSPRLRRWATVEEKFFAPFLGEVMRDALETGMVAEFVQNVQAVEDATGASCLTVEWFSVDDDTPLSEPIYVSISEPGFVQGISRTIVRQARLTTSEVLKLRPFFPKLAALLDVKHPELQSVPANVFGVPSPAAMPVELTGLADQREQDQ